ncbi:P-loop containing nucleoside triphosphate hydrolase protein [Rhizodiscina lignyota]|uniref:RNA helicase n=1 Tax=Rhizodiscina lignyota TaxID=1504668 RepID=A0A9P4M946_9PEZI|nr:P-loop containing nucleoside triphosphate hydrolase protein [Rhizodiscina lignyota]
MPKFVPRQRKHRVLARQKATGNSAVQNGDSNTVELLPTSKKEKEERRQQLRKELQAQQPKISSKKKKRLDKYIETKLRKEENLELIKKLAQTKVDTSLLHSSRKLGAVTDSKRDALSRAYHEREAGINSADNDAILLSARGDTNGDAFNGPLSDDEPNTSTADDAAISMGDEQESTGPTISRPEAASFGGGLKRPLELGEDRRPVIKKRQRVMQPKPQIIILNEHLKPLDGSESEWEGFSDDDKGSEESGNEMQSDDSDEEASEGDSSSSSDEEEHTDEDDESSSEGISGFKAWATQQRNAALGFTPSADTVMDVPKLPQNINFEPRPAESDPLPPELEVSEKGSSRKAYSVYVERSSKIQEARLALPVVAEEQKIMEAIHNNDVVVIWGATGSGKTTQVPQFLFEAGYGDKSGPTPGMIGVTQPRRVAAVSMAERVGNELGSFKRKVSYQIRFDHSNVSQETAIKFMTDGILLREISQDISLEKYSAVIIDEAHERSVNTDILIGMLSRVVLNVRAENAQRDVSRKPLKLIIMSATLRIKDFIENQRLFPQGPPPLVQAEGRQYPVTIHFSRKTQSDYVEEAFKKVSRGHKKLPPGGMLVFLTGQNEIVALEKRLKQSLTTANTGAVKAVNATVSAVDAPLEAEDMVIGRNRGLEDDESEDDLDIHGLDEENEDDNEDEEEFDVGQTAEDIQASSDLKVHVLPLYSQLPTKDQLRIFEPPPDGSRLIVLATNIAETSLTIAGIRYVFDCGRAKEKKYDLRSGVQSFEIDWISKASASQRAGRAGRTGPGHCYRLYSSALYEAHFAKHTEPEILRTPMEEVVLQLKGMGLPNIINFPFPTAPDRKNLEKAERLLQCLGAISLEGNVTPMGKRLSSFPLSPRFSRMLLIGQDKGCMSLTIALVSALSAPEMFIPQNQTGHIREQNVSDDESDEEKAAREARRKAYNRVQAQFSNLDAASDAIKFFTALCAYSWEAAGRQSERDIEDFCSSNFLRGKAMKEATQLREQLTTISRRNHPGSVGPFSMKVPTPSDAEVHLLRTTTAAGFIDQVAIRADLAPVPPEMSRKPSRATDVPYITLFSSQSSYMGGTGTDPSQKFVYLHPNSLLAHRSAAKLPQYVVYSHLQKNSTGKVRMHPLTPVSGAQLAVLARETPLLEWGKPVGKIEMIGQDRRICECVVSLIGDKGSTPWPLRSWKVKQKRLVGRGWVLEEIVE